MLWKSNKTRCYAQSARQGGHAAAVEAAGHVAAGAAALPVTAGATAEKQGSSVAPGSAASDGALLLPRPPPRIAGLRILGRHGPCQTLTETLNQHHRSPLGLLAAMACISLAGWNVLGSLSVR